MTPVATYLLHRQATVRPAHRFETIEELGSILVFAGRPQPNQAGDKFIYLQYRTIGSRTNDSWGLYVQDVSSGKRLMLDELFTPTWEDAWVNKVVRTFGWSPNDGYFAYARKRFRELVICDVNEGKTVAVFSSKTKLLSGAWLTPEKLVCSDGKQMFEFVKSGEQWHGPYNFASTEGGLKALNIEERQIESLQAFSTGTLFWKLGDAIMKNSATVEETPAVVWQLPTHQLVDFTCSQAAGKILLLGRDRQEHFLSSLEIHPKTEDCVAREIERFDSVNSRVSQVRLINSGQGYAYLSESDFSLNKVFFKMQMERAGVPASVPLQGEIKSFETSGQQLFLFGSLTNEPTGVWKFDIPSRSLERLASNQERPFHFAISQQPLRNSLTNEAGESLTYYLLPPTHIGAGEHPRLVLGVMGISEKTYYWDRYAQAIANSGAYFVTVDRRDRLEAEWGNDLRTVYDSLIRSIAVDTNNVYLLGISVGASHINRLFESTPAQWRGAIYISPVSLPETSCLDSKRLFVDIGEMDPIWGTNGIRAKTYQDRAAKARADVRLFIRPNVGHNCRLLSVEKERLHQLAAFLDDAD